MNPANAMHARMEAEAARLFQAEYGHFIDGQWVPGETGRTIDLLNPATGRVLSRIQAGGAVDVERAVQAAAAQALGTSSL